MAAAGKSFTLEIMGRQVDGYEAGIGKAGAPGVLVLHAWWGLTPWFKTLCDRLAAEGYVALTANMFGTSTASTIPEAEKLVKNHDQALAEAVAQAALARLRTHAPGGGLGLIGFSYGTWWAGELAAARPDNVSAAVLYYGTAGSDFTRCKAAFLGHYAETDDFEPLDGVRAMEAAMRAASLDCAIHVYPGTGHWFFEDNRPDAYDAAAAKLSWDRTRDFLKKRLR